MSKKQKGVEVNGDVLALSCWGCARWPIRRSWMTECSECGQYVCRVCTEETGCKCELGKLQAVAPPGGQ